MATWSEVVAFSESVVMREGDEVLTATPMRFSRIIMVDSKGDRISVAARWGFMDKRNQNNPRPKYMHARAETIERLPAFAEPFAKARGILPVHTFNVGEEMSNGKTRQWTVRPKDGQPLAIAVVMEQYGREAELFWSFCMVTTDANALIAPVTDRMPAIIKSDDWPLWLGEDRAPLDDVKALLMPFDGQGDWDFAPEPPKQRAPKKPKARQDDLFA